MIYRVEGMIIRSMDYGEGNKIVTLFTKEAGKISVMARGAKKVNSRLGAAVQPFTYGEYVFYKTGQMGTLNHAEILKSNQPLREDLMLSAYSAYMSELTDRMLPDSEGAPYLYEQLKAGFTAMTEGKNSAIIVHIYELKLLELAGYMPVLEHCVSCDEPSGEMVFSISAGGLLCRRCIYKDNRSIPLTDSFLKLLRICSKMDIRRLGQIQVKNETEIQLRQLLRAYYDSHAGLQLKSRYFLEQMEKYGV